MRACSLLEKWQARLDVFELRFLDFGGDPVAFLNTEPALDADVEIDHQMQSETVGMLSCRRGWISKARNVRPWDPVR